MVSLLGANIPTVTTIRATTVGINWQGIWQPTSLPGGNTCPSHQLDESRWQDTARERLPTPLDSGSALVTHVFPCASGLGVCCYRFGMEHNSCVSRRIHAKGQRCLQDWSLGQNDASYGHPHAYKYTLCETFHATLLTKVGIMRKEASEYEWRRKLG